MVLNVIRHSVTKRGLRRAGWSIVPLLLAGGVAGASGCSAASPEDASSGGSAITLDPILPIQPIQPLPPSPWPADGTSAAAAICAIVNDIPNFSVGDVNITKGPCTASNYQSFYYLGSDYYRPVFGGGVTQPARAQAMADALYCALKDSNGTTANGAAQTGLGQFGMVSKINVNHYDPTAMQINGQRLGTLYAFGVGLPIEDQDYVASFPTENLASSGPIGFNFGSTTGHYMTLQTSTVSWSLGGSGALGPFTLGMTFGQNGYFQSMNNNLFGWAGAGQVNTPNGAFTWNAWENSCNSCVPGGLIGCDCPSSTQISEHNADANMSMATYENLTDGVLPYQGDTGGVSGNYAYLNSSLNWTQFGPSPGGLVPAQPALGGLPAIGGDPTNNIQQNPSTYIDFNFGLSYDIISLELLLNLNFSSSMELTQGEGVLSDGPAYASVNDVLNAKSNATLNANLQIANPFPFGPNPLLNATFNLINANKDSGEVNGAAIEYDKTNGFPFYYYDTNATGIAGASAETACLAAPAVTNPPVQPSSPQTWVQQVTAQAQQNLFPCHVNLCNQSSASSVDGTLETCNWNSATQSLVCTQTSTPCTSCQNSVELCDSQGNTYAPTSTTNNNAFCNAQ